MACHKYYDYLCLGGDCQSCHRNIPLSWVIALSIFMGSILGLVIGLAVRL